MLSQKKKFPITIERISKYVYYPKTYEKINCNDAVKITFNKDNKNLHNEIKEKINSAAIMQKYHIREECKEIVDLLFLKFEPPIHTFKNIIITYVSGPKIILKNDDEQTINDDLVIPLDNLLYPDSWSQEAREADFREEIKKIEEFHEEIRRDRNNALQKGIFTGIFTGILFSSVVIAITLLMRR